MKQAANRKEPPQYTYIGFRPSKDIEKRVKRIARVTRRKVSAVIVQLLERGLPALEADTALKPEFREKNFTPSR